MVAEADPQKAKKVKCQDKNYPDCYHQDLYCPDSCHRNCQVDCASCQPVCSLDSQTSPPPPTTSPSPPPPSTIYPSPPPPPPKTIYSLSPPPPLTTSTPPSSHPPPPPPSPPLPSPKPKKHSPPPPYTIYSSPPPPPSTTIYSSPPPPPLTTPTPPSALSPPPPPASGSDGKKVKCINKNYPHCYAMEHSCPSGCPEQCEVDCVTCSPVCTTAKCGTWTRKWCTVDAAAGASIHGTVGDTYRSAGMMVQPFCMFHSCASSSGLPAASQP
ncbi:leucine-rich repeat extensin-like protein 3 [Quercus suber]|uniref:leucine-rich repeat extensin-like protein 3 n=1 Tax=Quercus suber TaxID=58331 RepID=UPI0032DFE7AF